MFWIKKYEKRAIFHPQSYSENRIDRLPDDLNFVRFNTTNGPSLTGVWKNGQSDSPVLVFAHGNAGHMLQRIGWFEQSLPEGWNGLLFDFRGYGLSDGTPSESGLFEDTYSAVQFALDKVDHSRIALHGRSLGTPLVAHVSQKIEVDSLILESGFPSAPAVAKTLIPIPFMSSLMSSQFNTIKYLKTAHNKNGPIPKFFIHGMRDNVIPFRLGRQLFQDAPEPKQRWFVEEAGHNDLPIKSGEEYSERVKRFLLNNTS